MNTIATLNDLGAALDEAQQLHEAGRDQDAGEACVSILRQLDGHSYGGEMSAVADTLRADTFTLLGTLSNIYQHYEQGETCFREATAAYRRARGNDDLFAHVALSNLALSLQGRQRIDAAIHVLEAATEGIKRNLHTGSRAASELARTLGTLGSIQVQNGHLSEASGSLEEAIKRSAAMGDEKSVEDFIIEASHYNTWGNLLRLQGQVLSSMSAIESAITRLLPLWTDFKHLVHQPMTAFLQNYDISKRGAGVTEDAKVVAKCRALL